MVDGADMIIPPLCEMRAENAARHTEIRGRLITLEKRLAEVQAALVDSLKRKMQVLECPK